jgi:hypothetical protein
MSGKCYGFMWVGQPFTSCDNCGQPYWEHTHEEVPHPAGGPFGRRLRRIISAADKEATRKKWAIR